MSDQQQNRPDDRNTAPRSGSAGGSGGPRPIITPLHSTEEQIGRHIVAALQQEDTVAVLTAVVIGDDGGQRIVSAPLHQQALHEVQALLHETDSAEMERVPCVGFHCYLPGKVDSGPLPPTPPIAPRDDS